MSAASYSIDDRGFVRITAVLFAAPIPWWPDYWKPNGWGGVESSDPLAEKPIVEMDVPLDETLGAVMAAACTAWVSSVEAGIRRFHPATRTCAKGNR